MQLLALREPSPGGELHATRALFDALRAEDVTFHIQELPKLIKTSSFSFAKWVLSSIFISAKTSWTHRHLPVVYSTTFLGVIGALIVRSFTKQRVIFHYHGSRMPNASQPTQALIRKLTQHIKHTVSFQLHRRAFRGCDVFFIPSLSALNELKKQFPESDFQRACVLPNGVNLNHFSPVDSSQQELLRRQFHIPRSSFVCLIISRINQEKRILETINFIDALHLFSRRRILVLLAFPEHGNDSAYLQQVQDRILHFEVPHLLIQGNKNIDELYQVSDCVLSHSSREVFPLALLEAAACGIPYFAAPNGVTEQYLADIDPELILPSSDQQAARQVLASTHRRKLFEKLRAFATLHSWQATAVMFRKTVLELR